VSVRPRGTTRLPQDGFLGNLVFEGSVDNLSRNFQVSLKSDKNNGYWREDRYTLSIISRSFLLRMKNVADKSCRENQNTHFVFNDCFFENLVVYEIMWKNIEWGGRPHMTIRRMRIACWAPKATNTQSDYVIFIASPLQQWLQERASVLHYTHIDCLIYVFWYIRSNSVCSAQPKHVAAYGFAITNNTMLTHSFQVTWRPP